MDRQDAPYAKMYALLREAAGAAIDLIVCNKSIEAALGLREALDRAERLCLSERRRSGKKEGELPQGEPRITEDR